MSEPNNTQLNDVEGSVLSGGFSGPVSVGEERTGQTVTINIPVPIEPPDTIRQQIKEIWMMFAHDRFERQDRQKEVDHNWQESKADRANLRQWIMVTLILVLISLAIGILNAIWNAQMIDRLGWLW